MQRPLLNIHDLNLDLYFEFYIQDDLFYRYSYSCKQTEFTLSQLVSDINHQLILQYNYRLFTGYSYDVNEINFGVIASIDDHCIYDILQNEKCTKDFPLFLSSAQSNLDDLLYLNLLIAFSDSIDIQEFRKSLLPYIDQIRARSQNPIWPVLYADQPTILPVIDSRINRFNNRIKAIKRYRNEDRAKEMKLKLANELLVFQQHVDRAVSRTLHVYDILLGLLHKDNLNLLRPEGERRESVFNNFQDGVMGENSDLILFCYGELDTMSDEKAVEYLKYFVMQYHVQLGMDLDLGKVNFHFRNRYNEISALKVKIVDSITAQIEKLMD